MTNRSHISESDFDLVEKYLAGQLEGDELKSFKLKLESNPQFKEQVETQRCLQEGVAHYAMKQQLEEIHNRIYPPKNNRFWGFSVAAAAILLFAVAVWWWQRPEPHLRLFDTYYTAEPGLPTPMSADAENYVFYSAMVAYKNAEYPLAIHQFDSLAVAYPRETRYQYFLASSYLNSEQVDKAIPILEKLAAKDQDKYQAKAQWYLAMALLQSNRLDELQDLLNQPLPANKERFEALEAALHEEF